MMAGNDIKKKMEELSEALVFAEPSDYQALADLHTSFAEIGEWANQNAQPEIAKAASTAGELIESVILEEANDPQASFELVGNIVAVMQGVICEGRSADEVDFPEELGLGKGSDASSGEISDGVSHPATLPAHVDEKIFADFLTRQGEVLQEMEGLILALEKADDESKLGELRRHIHTLKGESALLGLNDVERLCHTTEDALNEVEPSALVDTLLEIKDWLVRAFESYSGTGPAPEPVGQVLELVTAPQVSGEVPPSSPEALPDEEQDKAGEAESASQPEAEIEADAAPPAAMLEADVALLGDFVSESMEHLESSDVHLLTLETEPQDEEALNAVFRAFHTIKGVAGFLALDDIQALAHEAENLLDRARKGKLVLEDTAIDVTFDAVDSLKHHVEIVRTALATGEQPLKDQNLPALLERIKDVSTGKTDSTEESSPPASPDQMLGEILVETGAATQETVDSALDKQEKAEEKKQLGTVLAKDERVAAKDVAQALRAQQKAAGGRKASVQVKETVKVDADRLDRLLDTIGELVIAESMVVQSNELNGIASTELVRQLGQLDKITRELQAMGTSLRMVPVRATFQKMARLVRDLAKKSNKQVEFNTAGDDTELDKTVVDRIGDPLVHMVRNAVDHGLEASEEDRLNTGKSAQGRVELRAYHKGGNIYIEVEDDGRGLDREAILAKALKRGLVQEGETLSDREIFNLIFEPGFSTAKKVTDVSGRGVGMDVVRRNIEALRGQCDIRSEPGKGSVFTIRLPLTLAIIDGMVIRVGTERYIIPTLSVVMSIRPEPEDLSTVLNRGEMLTLQGDLIPLFRLSRLFDVGNAERDITNSLVVIVEDDGHKTGLLTDELLGQQQIVIKSLGETMQGIPGISGGAIMPDGQVGLILDVSGLVKLANTDSNGLTDGG